MPFPKTFSLIVRHNFGANAVVTCNFFGFQLNSSGLPVYDGSQTVVFNASIVADETDVESSDYDQGTLQLHGLRGNVSVQAQAGSVTGVADLWLRTKTSINSDSILSEPLVSIPFDNDSIAKIASFAADL